MVKVIPVTQMGRSQTAIVHEVTGDPKLVERVVRLGILEATPLTVAGPGPAPDTLTINLPEATFTLTMAEAETIKVYMGIPEELDD